LPYLKQTITLNENAYVKTNNEKKKPMKNKNAPFNWKKVKGFPISGTSH